MDARMLELGDDQTLEATESGGGDLRASRLSGDGYDTLQMSGGSTTPAPCSAVNNGGLAGLASSWLHFSRSLARASASHVHSYTRSPSVLGDSLISNDGMMSNCARIKGYFVSTLREAGRRFGDWCYRHRFRRASSFRWAI